MFEIRERILLHLYSLIANYELADKPYALTQYGTSAAIRRNQSSVSRCMRLLWAENLVMKKKDRVEGRRRQVNMLTPEGVRSTEELYSDLLASELEIDGRQVVAEKAWKDSNHPHFLQFLIEHEDGPAEDEVSEPRRPLIEGFVGRQSDLAALESKTQLLFIVAPVGMGKTALVKVHAEAHDQTYLHPVRRRDTPESIARHFSKAVFELVEDPLEFLRTNAWTIILDGADHPGLQDFIEDASETQLKGRLIVTCRQLPQWLDHNYTPDSRISVHILQPLQKADMLQLASESTWNTWGGLPLAASLDDTTLENLICTHMRNTADDRTTCEFLAMRPMPTSAEMLRSLSNVNKDTVDRLVAQGMVICVEDGF